MLEVEDWTQPSQSNKRRVSSRKTSTSTEKEPKVVSTVEAPNIPPEPPQAEVEDSFRVNRPPHLFNPVRTRANSSPTAGPSSLSRLLRRRRQKMDLRQSRRLRLGRLHLPRLHRRHHPRPIIPDLYHTHMRLECLPLSVQALELPEYHHPPNSQRGAYHPSGAALLLGHLVHPRHRPPLHFQNKPSPHHHHPLREGLHLPKVQYQKGCRIF